MKNIHYICYSALLILASCGINSHKAQSNTPDSLVTNSPANTDSTQKTLSAKLSMPATIKAGDSVLLHFTVINNTNSSMRFCKWHTPFEPLLSKYLEVKNEKGEEMAYQGAMAKRIMPPPESSYLTVKAGDSVSTNVNLLKGYAINGTGKYTVTYVGENMSGLKASNKVDFNYTNK